MSDFDLQDRIELLVEGELSIDDKRELLEQIEQRPQLWRDVGIAFLDHQKLAPHVRAVVSQEATSNPTPGPIAVTSIRHGRKTAATISWTHLFTLTACMLFAFGIGMIVQTQTPQPIATGIGAMKVQVNDDPISESNEKPPTPDSADPYRIVGVVRWNSNAGVRVSPVFDGTPDQKWLSENPPSVDEKVRRSFSRAGWQIRPQRRLVSMQLKSGGRYTIPIDDVTYQFVGRQIF